MVGVGVIWKKGRGRPKNWLGLSYVCRCRPPSWGQGDYLNQSLDFGWHDPNRLQWSRCIHCLSFIRSSLSEFLKTILLFHWFIFSCLRRLIFTVITQWGVFVIFRKMLHHMTFKSISPSITVIDTIIEAFLLKSVIVRKGFWRLFNFIEIMDWFKLHNLWKPESAGLPFHRNMGPLIGAHQRPRTRESNSRPSVSYANTWPLHPRASRFSMVIESWFQLNQLSYIKLRY